jgi:hypothetical protein
LAQEASGAIGREDWPAAEGALRKLISLAPSDPALSKVGAHAKAAFERAEVDLAAGHVKAATCG